MYNDGVYGVVGVGPDIFNAIDKNMLISGSTEKVKYLCANEKETEHLLRLGVEADYGFCDYYRIELKEK